MGKPLSEDLRARLIKNIEKGMSARAAGRKLDIPPSTATSIALQWRERGSYVALQVGGHRRVALEKEVEFIEDMVKVAGVREIVEGAGAKLVYLPPYSPDLNPIEQVFAKLKALLRKAMARSFEVLCEAIGRILRLFKPDECANYFANSGYGRI